MVISREDMYIERYRKAREEQERIRERTTYVSSKTKGMKGKDGSCKYNNFSTNKKYDNERLQDVMTTG